MTAKSLSFSIQLGSGGFEVARSVAEQLGYGYYDWEVTSRAAAEAGVTLDEIARAERLPSLIERMMSRFLQSANYDDSIFIPGDPSTALSGAGLAALTLDDYRKFIEEVVKELAERGAAVIAGHASQLVLAEDPSVLKVLLHAPKGKRIERLALESGLSLPDAQKAIERSDRERSEFFSKVYHVDWLSGTLYDLSLDTDRLTLERTKRLVVAAAKALSGSSAMAEVFGAQSRLWAEGAAVEPSSQTGAT